MSKIKVVALACLVAACTWMALVASPNAQADTHSSRQYYGGWQHHAKGGYHYRPYYYKPSPTYAGYRHHYVIHHPKRPQHLYFYNPKAKKYWGRCPVDAEGKPAYSMLAEKDRAADLEAIPDSAFPAPNELPPIPDSSDGALLDLPPSDLPPGLSSPE